MFIFNKFTIEQIFKVGMHLGVFTVAFNSNFKKFKLPVVNITRYSIINLQYSIINFKKVISLLLYIISKRGQFLIVNELLSLERFLKFYFSETMQPVSSLNWVPGYLTNFKQIRVKTLRAYYHKRFLVKKIDKLVQIKGINKTLKNEIFKNFNKLTYLKELKRYIKFFFMVPNIVFVSNSILASLALKEAKVLHIPSVAILDSNSSPTLATYSIPGNSTSTHSLIFYYVLLKHVALKSFQVERKRFLLKVLRLKKRIIFKLRSNKIDFLLKFNTFSNNLTTYKYKWSKFFLFVSKGYFNWFIKKMKNVYLKKYKVNFLFFQSKLISNDIKFYKLFLIFSKICKFNYIQKLPVNPLNFKNYTNIYFYVFSLNLYKRGLKKFKDTNMHKWLYLTLFFNVKKLFFFDYFNSIFFIQFFNFINEFKNSFLVYDFKYYLKLWVNSIKFCVISHDTITITNNKIYFRNYSVLKLLQNNTFPFNFKKYLLKKNYYFSKLH